MSLAYGKKLCDMGYGNFVNNPVRLALKHIHRRINHMQLTARLADIVSLHTEEGYKDEFKKFTRKLLREVEAVDRFEISTSNSG